MDANRNNTKRKYQSAMPIIDEGWWESVLAEDRQYRSPRPSQGLTKPKVFPEAKTETVPVSAPATTDWDTLRELFSKDQIIAMKVTGHNRGGLLVENGRLSGFIPFSHLIDLAGREHESDRHVSLESYVGRMVNVKVIECVQEEERVVFSERAALAEPGKRGELFNNLQPGSQVRGVVTNITDFGVFVDLGGVEGLIHISELSWGRVLHPSQIVKLGEEIQVQVLEIAPERCRVALSLKRLRSNPWERAATDFPVGTIHTAVITSVVSYGAFARIEAGVEGLIHASEMAFAPHQSPRETFSEGQELKVRILHLDVAHQRMGLSLLLQNQ
ncbi:MAG TPA: S1 RNA-binding domain-containing protein, partial [Anaerolineales bacterium]|nr:S1 RNA-binding domain-containing protein [Anaerolineales bacterium]